MDEEDDIEIRSNSSEDEQFQEATNKRRKIRGPLSIIQEDNSAADDIGIKNHLDEKVEDSFQHNQVRKVKRFVEVDDFFCLESDNNDDDDDECEETNVKFIDVDDMPEETDDECEDTNEVNEKVEDSFQHNQVRKVKRFVDVDDFLCLESDNDNDDDDFKSIDVDDMPEETDDECEDTNEVNEKVEDSFQHMQVRKVKRFVEVDDICPVPEELMEKSDEEEMNELPEYDAVPKKKTSIVIDLTNTADSDDE